MVWWLLPLIGGLLGAGAGLLGTGQSLKRQQKELERQKAAAAQQYGYGKELSEKQWGIQSGEAAYQLGAQEKALHEGMGQFTDEYNTAMLSRAFGEQDARIQNAVGMGMSRVQEGASGTRGNAANELMRAYAGASLERDLDLQRRQDGHALAGTITGANRTVQEIGHERDSWNAGGWRYESKAAQDKYNLNMFNAGQAEFEWGLDQLSPGNMVWDYIAGMFGGASTGLSVAASAHVLNQNTGGDWWSNVFKPKAVKPDSGKIVPDFWALG